MVLKMIGQKRAKIAVDRDRVEEIFISAIQNQNLPLIKSLGGLVNVNEFHNEMPLLQRALRGKHAKVVKSMLDVCSNINDRGVDYSYGKGEYSMLKWALIYDCDEEIIKILLEHDANVNDEKDNILHESIHTFDLRIIESLLEAGAKVEKLNEKGETALHVLLKEKTNTAEEMPEFTKCQENICKLLICYGVPFGPKDSDGKRAFDLAHTRKLRYMIRLEAEENEDFYRR